MKLENQVVSLELAKRLKELGVKQESLVYWSDWCLLEEGKTPQKVLRVRYGNPNFSKTHYSYFWEEDQVSAFTVAELGEMLPSEITERRPNIEVFGENAKSKYLGLDFFEDQVNDSYGLTRVWRVSVGKVQFRESTEADARAKMLIYLLENKLISVE